MGGNYYLLDGVAIHWVKLVQFAKSEYGYDGEFLTTSGAARILREQGHEVEMLQDERAPADEP